MQDLNFFHKKLQTADKSDLNDNKKLNELSFDWVKNKMIKNY